MSQQCQKHTHMLVRHICFELQMGDLEKRLHDVMTLTNVIVFKRLYFRPSTLK